MNNRNHKLPYLKIILLLILLGIIAVAFLILGKPKAQREDYKKIFSAEYDAVFLSMYPTEPYPEEVFQENLGLNVLKASYCIPRFSIVRQYMRLIDKSENTVRAVCLGIRPDKTDFRELQDLINQYPSIAFEIILAHPSMDYWVGLSDRKYEQVLAAYSSFLLALPDIPNVRVSFHGSQEWLIANPSNYENDWLLNDPIAKTVLLESTTSNDYLVLPENAVSYFQELADLTQSARSTSHSYPDLSDYCLVFLGDSVIANYTDSASIPGVVSGFTQAAVYNCGFGGNSASVTEGSPIALADIAEAFTTGNLSRLPKDMPVYQGLSSYLSDNPSDKKLCVIINYGLNDYFQGCPISSDEDPFDVTTFCGAIRTAVNTIHTRFPNARIILCTPSYCYYCVEGKEPHGEGNYILEDYVSAVLSLSQELQTDVLDTYHTFGINDQNWNMYLVPDQIHPKASYRYLIGKSLISLIDRNPKP